MNYYYLCMGLFILYISYMELREKQTDTDSLEIFDILAWIPFTRDDNPMMYWILISLQICVGLGMVVKGFLG